MTITLALALIGIALFDSINPSLFIAQFYLLSTPRPVPRVLAYIAGILLVNFLGGALLLGGMRAVLVSLLTTLDPNVLYGVELLLGFALIGFALWMRVGTKTNAEPKIPRSMHLGHAFLLGIVVMGNELTTALPYFFALERMAQAQLALLPTIFGLLLYNGVFAIPLFAFLGIFLAARQRFADRIATINAGITYWMPRIIRYGSLIFGGLLALDAVAYFIAGEALFT